MVSGKFIAYFRVSTQRQGQSGLGLDAQRHSVMSYLNGGDWQLLGEYTDIESGKHDNRPQLQAAMKHCRLTGATLVIAKLDRLSRDASFLIGLEKSGIEFVAVDIPNANRLTIGIMAVMVQHEREMISLRTREALAAAKKRGVKLGGFRNGFVPDPKLATAVIKQNADQFAESIGPMVRAMRDNGMKLLDIAATLTQQGIKTQRNGTWTAAGVSRILNRLDAIDQPNL